MSNPAIGRMRSFGISSDLKTSPSEKPQDQWAVILAGGDGSRLLPLTRKLAGDDRPKQFCPIINGTTLLDETRRRVALTLSSAKTMFVLDQKHEPYYDEALKGVPLGNLIVQPKNAGTTPAILYSLLRLEQIDPAATAAFFPSDHYFSDDRAFVADVDLAFATARRQPDLVILLGIEPDSPDEEYGWIEPERKFSKDATSDLYRVRRFWEKPSSALARLLMERGCLWNSFVMVGTVSAFLKMIRLSTSELFMKFAAAKQAMSSTSEKNAIEGLYGEICYSDFSSEVLQTRPGDLAVVRVGASKWSDLGSPHRVSAALSDISDASCSPTDFYR